MNSHEIWLISNTQTAGSLSCILGTELSSDTETKQVRQLYQTATIPAQIFNPLFYITGSTAFCEIWSSLWMTLKPKMSIFKRKKSLVINDHDPTYKVKYLGNVQTAMMKGDGCVDKPVGIIWHTYTRNCSQGLEMKLTLTSSGLKAYTKQQGLTEYRAHRISYCIAHPSFPKLFVWVYRHEGKIFVLLYHFSL